MDESRDFRRLVRRTAVRAALAMVLVAIGSWVLSGFERTWAEVAAAAGFAAIVIVAGALLFAPDQEAD